MRPARRRDGGHQRNRGKVDAAAVAAEARARDAALRRATSGAATSSKKTIKGSETSIFVGLAAAFVATFIGTVLGALAGYYGRWVDDALNWFYSVFSSIPYLLLILAVAAVLQQKGMMTIILILGLTGWTGVFRLIRAEYLKHKGTRVRAGRRRASARRTRAGCSCTSSRTSRTSCSCSCRSSSSASSSRR